MSIACRGITHCEQCGTPLDMSEFCLCNNCESRRKEEKTMSKTYKGWELIKAISEGKIKDKSKFIVYENGEEYFVDPVMYEDGVIRQNGTLLTEFITLEVLSTLSFELIEEEIDIQEELRELLLEQLTEREHTNADVYMLGKQINALTRAVKKLDKKIKEKE